jgi:hypothetical protein
MRESRQTIAKLLAAFADTLNSMDDSEFDLFIEGKAKLRLVEKAQNRIKFSDDTRLAETITELSQKLNDAESRADAESLIASIKHPRRKDFLLGLAKACGVSVGSKDSIAGIERKLIENVVGAKLRSQAIKNVAF